MKLPEDLIFQHIKQWINALNSRDIDSILSLYNDNIKLSPKIKKLFSDHKNNLE